MYFVKYTDLDLVEIISSNEDKSLLIMKSPGHSDWTVSKSVAELEDGSSKKYSDISKVPSEALRAVLKVLFNGAEKELRKLL